MTIWDKIYKNYKKGGEAWATLSEDIHPLFLEMLEKSEFKLKKAFDVGCGTGKYLKFLEGFGFEPNGLDSSQTAVEMTKSLLKNSRNILCANMFEFDLGREKYDLIFSVSTIHHGTKSQVQALINKIFDALVDSGKIFITVPNFEAAKKWETFKNHEKIEEGTYAPLKGPEQGLPHSFYTKEEIEKLFSKFKITSLNLDEIGRWVIQAEK